MAPSSVAVSIFDSGALAVCWYATDKLHPNVNIWTIFVSGQQAYSRLYFVMTDSVDKLNAKPLDECTLLAHQAEGMTFKLV